MRRLRALELEEVDVVIGPVVFVAALALLFVVALRCFEIDEAELVDGPVDARDLRGLGVGLVEVAVSADEFVAALNTVATSIERFRDLSDVHVCRPAREIRPERSLHAHGIAVDVFKSPGRPAGPTKGNPTMTTNRDDQIWSKIPGLSAGDALVLLGLERVRDLGGEWPTFEPAEVAAVTGQSRSRVEAGLRRLADLGLVQRDYRLGPRPVIGPPPVRVVYSTAEFTADRLEEKS